MDSCPRGIVIWGYATADANKQTTKDSELHFDTFSGRKGSVAHVSAMDFR